MGYTSSSATIQRWDPPTKTLKYCSSEVFDQHNNNFGKGWSPCSELMIVGNTSILITLKFTHQIIPSSKMIYFNSMLICHKEVILLISLYNTVNIITCHICPIQPKIDHAIIPSHK